MSKFRRFVVDDIRFATSCDFDGSAAMNPDPDYSAAHLRATTDADDSQVGHAFVFTIARGNDVQCAAISAFEPWLVGRDSEEVLADIGRLYRELVYDSQLRWLGPEKGVMHMAIGAVVRTLWSLRTKRESVPLWLLLARPGADRRSRRFPLCLRPAHPGAGPRDPASRGAQPRSPDRRIAARRIPRVYDNPGLARATRTTSCASCAARPSTMASLRSS